MLFEYRKTSVIGVTLKNLFQNDKHYLLNPYYDEIQSKNKQDVDLHIRDVASQKLVKKIFTAD